MNQPGQDEEQGGALTATDTFVDSAEANEGNGESLDLGLEPTDGDTPAEEAEPDPVEGDE